MKENIIEVKIEKWKLRGTGEICNEVNLEYDGEEIGTLYSDKEKTIILLPEKYLSEKYKDFSPIWLLEFVKFKFKGKNGWKLKKIGKLEEKGEKGKISSKQNMEEEKKKIWITDENPFENYTGKSEIVFEKVNTNKSPPLPVEVVSKKLIPGYENNRIETGSPLFYPEFSKNLINDVWRLISALPFNIETPVFVSSGFSTGAPHKIFTFFFLKNYEEEIKASLNIIRANPYRVLSEEKEFVNISEVSEIDNDTIYNILTHPEYLCECNDGKGFEVKGKYYAPLKLLQPIKYETLDTPENRFVLYFVKLLLRDIEDLMKEIETIFKEEKNKDFGETKRTIEDLKGLFEDFVKDPVWEEVGELFIFPSTSTVLRMRDGYRELYSLYLKYLFSRKPFEKIQEAIDLRKVYDLYEFWCALKLCEMLNKKENKINIRPGDKIPETFEMSFKFSLEDKDKYKFHYQKSKKSYSGLSLRPDFSIYKGKELVLLLDAKFAFDTESIEGGEDEIEKAEKENRFPKTGDIIKMHAYKDALKAKTCIVLYPGDEGKFCKEEGEKTTECENKDKNVLFEILKKDYKGIGWIPFLP